MEVDDESVSRAVWLCRRAVIRGAIRSLVASARRVRLCGRVLAPRASAVGCSARSRMSVDTTAVLPMATLGAEVDLDLGHLLTATDLGQTRVASHLRDLLDTHGLLVLRNQRLDPGQHLALAQWFGPVFPLPPRFQHEKSPHTNILRVSNDATEGFTGVGASSWHIDGASYDSPFTVSLLYSQQVPTVSAPTAFIALRPLASRILERRPEWQRLVACVGRGEKQVKHPLIFSHPRTKQPGVILGKLTGLVWQSQGQAECGETEPEVGAAGVSDSREDELLHELRVHTEAWAAVAAYRHEWKEGDLVLFDNLAVAHWAPPETQVYQCVFCLCLFCCCVNDVQMESVFWRLGGEGDVSRSLARTFSFYLS